MTKHQPEPMMSRINKAGTYVRLTAMWGNDDAESSIEVSPQRWQQIQDGAPYDTTAWSWYEGTRSRASWSFDDGKLTISLDDGFEIDLTTKRLYVNEVTSAPRPKK